MSDLVQSVHNDLLLVQEAFGSEFIYEEHEGRLIAIEFNEDGDEVSRYVVKVSLEKL